MTKYYIKSLSKIESPSSHDLAWLLTKLVYSVFWIILMFMMIGKCTESCAFPTGMCKLNSFSILFTNVGKVLLSIAIITSVAMYVLEIKMVYTLSFLFLISCIVMSHYESNGMFSRATVFSIIWFAQLLAYSIRYLNADFDLRYWRIQYSVQSIAACYTLAGISKLYASGLGWIYIGPLFSLQIMKNYAFLYSDTGAIGYIYQAKSMAYELTKHNISLTIMLAISLVLESFCLLVSFNKSIRIIFGIGLMLMHIGIAFILGIGISAIAFPMCIFFIIPLIAWQFCLINFQRSHTSRNAP
jgi:hypothetical protein